MTTNSGFWGPPTRANFIWGIIVFFLAGICFGIALGIRIERNSIDPETMEDIEALRVQAELAEQLDRVLTIYNNELKHILQNYQQAMRILNKRR